MGFFDSLGKSKVKGIIKFLKLEDWYCSLTTEEQRKLKDYSGEGEGLIRGDIWSTQTQKHFFWTTATSAIYSKDYEFAIFLAKKGVTAQGSLVDQHFIYNAFIEAYWRQNDYENAKKYCYTELSELSKIGNALKKEYGGIPVSPWGDILFKIVVKIEKDYEEGERLINLFLQKGLLTQEEAQGKLQKLQKLRIDKMHSKAKELLEKGNFEEAKSIYDDIIKVNESQAADIYKTLGNYFLENKRDQEALQYFQKSVHINPLISGVKSKLQKLSKKLGVEVKSTEECVLNTLHEKEKTANEWWEGDGMKRKKRL